MFVQVALDIPLFTTFTYKVPDHLKNSVEPGQLIQVPFRNRAKTGLSISLSDTQNDDSLDGKIREILDIVDHEPLLTQTGLEFLTFVADYYLAPIGEVMRLALPSAIRAEGLKHYLLREGSPELKDVPPELHAAYNELLSFKPISINKLKNTHPKLTFYQLTWFETENYVDVYYEDTSSKPRVLNEYFYKLSKNSDPQSRIGSKQQAILDALKKHGICSLTQLKESINAPQSSLKSLQERGLIESWQKEIYRDPFINEPIYAPKSITLTTAQHEAVDTISQAINKRVFEGFVLHGVTGSGKTEVYVRSIQAALAKQRRALVLLPEIALTPQFVAVFRGYFGNAIAVLHSGLTQAEKFDQWRRIKRNEVDIIIGARSAIFAPIENLGIIIVDEEHDSSFKQEEGPRYNARDMALVRGKLEYVPVVLGSATPNIESYYNAQEGRLTYLSMPDRANDRPLPEVKLVDLRVKTPGEVITSNDSPPNIISPCLRDSIDSTLASGMQVILFLNRRGYSPCVLCNYCGYRFGCPNCDVSLTYHRWQESLRCHHCDYSIRLPESCPKCFTPGVGRKGIGTEKLEEQLREIFPKARIGRLDRDTGSGKNLQRILRQFRAGEINLLIGTQMVTKGHDFPSVTAVGVVSADMSLNFPDFRAAERTFQLLTQVAGRAGRGDTPGNVIIQTYMPEHYSLEAACTHDYRAFITDELSMRRDLGYPPFSHLIAIKFEAASDGAVVQAARDYASAARNRLRRDASWAQHITMLGPAVAPISRIKNRMRWQLLLKSSSRKYLRQFAIALLSDVGYFSNSDKRHQNVRIIVDVDPQNML